MITLSWTLNGQNTDVMVDATLKEAPEAAAQVTEHQVEREPNITDHIRPLPRKLTIDAFITNTPIKGDILAPTGGVPGALRQLNDTGFTTLQFDSEFDRIGSVYAALTLALKNGALVTITTAFQVYVDYAITHISSPRDSEHSTALVFSIDFQEIIQASVVEVESPAPKLQKKHVGQKTTVAATAEQQVKSQSMLHRLVH